MNSIVSIPVWSLFPRSRLRGQAHLAHRLQVSSKPWAENPTWTFHERNQRNKGGWATPQLCKLWKQTMLMIVDAYHMVDKRWCISYGIIWLTNSIRSSFDSFYWLWIPLAPNHSHQMDGSNISLAKFAGLPHGQNAWNSMPWDHIFTGLHSIAAHIPGETWPGVPVARHVGGFITLKMGEKFKWS